MILAPGLMLGVVKVSTQMTPKGNEVHSSHGRNLPHLRAGAVGDDAHYGIEERNAEPDTRNIVPAWAAVKPKGVGVEIQLQGQQRLEDEVGCQIAQAVAKLFSRRKVSRSLPPRLSPALPAASTASLGA